jgi:hypothetical protein
MQWSKEKKTNNVMVKRKKRQTMQWSKEKGTKRQ